MRRIPDTGFGDDDGSADPALRHDLAAAARGRSSGPALARLLGSRLLVPVVAVPAETSAATIDTGATADSASADAVRRRGAEGTADMAVVLMTGRDGRQALLAFSGLDALHRWRSDARPVPMPAPQVARAALDEDAAAVVVDVAGPAPFVLEGDDLRRAAAGSRLVRIGAGYGWAVPRAGRTGPV